MPSQPQPQPPGVQLGVRGTVPPGLTGRFTAVGDGLIHTLDVAPDRVTHLVRPIRTPGAVRELVSVDGSVLAFTDSAAVVELGETGTSRLMDLAGPGRVAATGPVPDPITGELHLIARGAVGNHAHVVVSSGRLTRRSHPISRVPGDIRRIAVGRAHVVAVTDGAIGIVPRSGEGPTTWIPIEPATPVPVHVDDTHGDVVLILLTPSLERWTVHPASAAPTRRMLDASPKRFAATRGTVGDTPTTVWTAGGRIITRHDLCGPHSVERELAPNAPGDFVLVPGDEPSATADGWFIGLVHHAAGGASEVHIVGLDDPAMRTVASIQLPHRLPLDARCTWTTQRPTAHPADDHHAQESPS